jgi:hypothetical protein
MGGEWESIMNLPNQTKPAMRLILLAVASMLIAVAAAPGLSRAVQAANEPNADTAIDTEQAQAPKPQYVPGEVIVKLKDGSYHSAFGVPRRRTKISRFIRQLCLAWKKSMVLARAGRSSSGLANYARLRSAPRDAGRLVLHCQNRQASRT